MTDPTTQAPPQCEWTNPDPGVDPTGCHLPASYETKDGPRCDEHAPARVGGRVPIHWDGDDDAAGDYRGDVRNAIETALAATPKDARTVEAKAEWLHEHLERAGWVLMHPEGDERPVLLGRGDEIVNVPDGYDVTVTRTAIDGPGDQLVDPELSELAEIVARLEGLDPESRERVAAFVTHRYGPVTPVPVGRPSWLDITNPSRAMDAAIRGVDPEARRPMAQGGVIGRPQATRISE